MSIKKYLLIDTVLDHFTIILGNLSNNNKNVDIQYHKVTTDIDQIVDILYQGLKQIAWNSSDIIHGIINVGPGRFTGIRIAQVISQALSWNPKIKVHTITTLDLIKFILPPGHYNVILPISNNLGLWLSDNYTTDMLTQITSLNIQKLRDKLLDTETIHHTWCLYWPVLQNVLMNDVVLSKLNKYSILMINPESWQTALNRMFATQELTNYQNQKSSIYGKTLFLQQLSGKKTWL